MQSVDVIIPVYRPDEGFLDLIEQLKRQDHAVHKIIIANTEKRYWDDLVNCHASLRDMENLEVHHLEKKDFDHGATRRWAVKFSEAEYFLMMTQDAIPADDHLVENLLKPFADPQVAVSYARQLPKKGATTPVEDITRAFNYPSESRRKSKADIENLGIKTYFCSNVCAMYRRDVYQKLGGFVKEAIFNEDMYYAAAAVNAGYEIAYEASAKVYHSHVYSNQKQFQRNFDLGVSQADHPEIFEKVPSESEGVKLVKRTALGLLKRGRGLLIIPMLVTSAYKYFGYKAGKNYQNLTKKQIMKYTMNPTFWERRWESLSQK
ncbi:MAG: glycosyltransferase family 2 protein [Lachnospiraceae bacterium]|nr:glycosyltransferase family 2 protein [Lachnospiraceae bacterium]MBQ5376535.1 glycosyltransferase family 2 protein [Lachnospiraceae bacterium]